MTHYLRKKFIAFLAITVIFFPLESIGQKKGDPEFRKYFNEALGLMEEGNYIKALPLLLRLDSMDPANANVKNKIGLCYLQSTLEKQKALPYFEKAVTAASPEYLEDDPFERKAPLSVYSDIAQAYRINYHFDTAIAYYHKYSKIVNPKDKASVKELERQIRICRSAKTAVANPVKSIITNLGSTVNSPFPDYSPVLTADESMIIFTSRRTVGKTGKLDETGQNFEDIYISYNKDGEWSDAVPIDTAINTPGHEATIGLSIDGSYLLIYRDDAGDGNVYQSYFNGEQWSTPEKFSSGLNSSSWETHAVYNADGNTVFFVSDRPGGLGGRDIYRIKRMSSGEWSLPLNLGPCVNTPYDEDAPYLHPDGYTLYFASCGHSSIGGFDIFSTNINQEDDKCTPPVNVGYPINTPDDDVFYVVSTDGKRAYYSSIKKGGFGDKDIYLISLPEAEEKNLALIKGVFTDLTGVVPEDATITVTDNETGEIIGVYRPNPKTGKYLFILPQGRNFNVTFEAQGLLFHSENLEIPTGSAYSEIEKPVELKPLKAGAATTLNNLFFESGKATIRFESTVELERVLKMMKENPTVKIEISGHTDSKGSDDYNMNLSQQRAAAVVKYLSDKGIEPARIVPKGYGETNPVAPNANPDGSENPDGMAKNRRIEMKILE
ncbi:MAG: OmpA family protein [Bacteroidetes bacterium]|nr:OmpA family protein [Bacteroidota bacterium]